MASVANINQVFEGHGALEIECVDRLYLNADMPTLQVGGQVMRFLCSHIRDLHTRRVRHPPLIAAPAHDLVRGPKKIPVCVASVVSKHPSV